MSNLAIIKDDRYLEHKAGEAHPESPNRLRVIHDLIAREFSDLPLIQPRLATEDELAAVHDPSYIRMIANTEGQAFTRIDPDTGLSARSYEIARLAAGGLLNAVDALLTHDPGPMTPASVFDMLSAANMCGSTSPYAYLIAKAMKSVRKPAVMIAITRFGILCNVVLYRDHVVKKNL